MTTRIICNDGLQYVGAYDSRRSNSHRVYLLGHMHYTWRRNIREMFEYKDRWYRVMGNRNIYDNYIETGGLTHPSTFFNVLYSDDF